MNGQFNNGTTCPLVTRSNMLCPVLCVTDHQLCPPEFGPNACSLGTTLCPDGSCSITCSSFSPCSCPSRLGKNLKACKSTSFYVDIPNYDPQQVSVQQYHACSSAMVGTHIVMDTWASLKDGDAMIWNVCDAPKGVIFPIQCETHQIKKYSCF